MGEALATLAQYKTYKKIPTTNINEDASLTQMLNASSAFIKEYCQRSFIDYFDEEKIEYRDGSDYEKLYVKEYPINSLIFEYSEDGGQTYTLATEFIDFYIGGDYISSGSTAPLWNPLISHRAIKLTYTAGFEELPADLVQATMDLTEYFRKTEYNPKSSMGTNMVEHSNKDGADITKLPAHIFRVLSNYRTIE